MFSVCKRLCCTNQNHLSGLQVKTRTHYLVFSPQKMHISCAHRLTYTLKPKHKVKRWSLVTVISINLQPTASQMWCSFIFAFLVLPPLTLPYSCNSLHSFHYATSFTFLKLEWKQPLPKNLPEKRISSS